MDIEILTENNFFMLQNIFILGFFKCKNHS